MRILIVKLSSFGDILHVLPTVNVLRNHFETPVDWLTQTEYASLVGCFPDVNAIFTVDRHGGWRDLCKVLRTLRQRHYDLVVDLQGLQKSALVARLAGGKRCVGPSCQREGARFWYHAVAAPRNRCRHAVEQALDVLPLLGIAKPVERQFPLRLPDDPLIAPRPRVGLAPVSRWPSKNWPLSNFAMLADCLQQDHHVGISVFGGRADLPAAETIQAGCRLPVEIHCGDLDWPQLGAALAGLDVLVSNDSGPVHLAAAVGTPCVVVYGPTDPTRTAPWGSLHRILKTGMPCRGCYRRRCRYPDDRCWRDIPPKRVLAQVIDLLADDNGTALDS